MSTATFYVIVWATLNRVPLMLPILSLPGPAPTTPEPIYAPQTPAPPYQDDQGQWQPGYPAYPGTPGYPGAPGAPGTPGAPGSPGDDGAPWTPDPTVPDASQGHTGTYEDFFFTAAGTCPSARITEIVADKHKDILTPPEDAVEAYEAKGLLSANGTLAMDYTTIENGGSMCIADSDPQTHILLGGMFFWETATGKCMLPPKDEAENPCCMVHMWQTDAEGMYYGDCTMKMAIPPSGMYFFRTVIPGPETDSGWGDDPAPHFSYDVSCSGCVTDEMVDGAYAWWGKAYPEGLCEDTDACGNVGTVHQVQEKQVVNGEVLYKYDFVLPKIAAVS